MWDEQGQQVLFLKKKFRRSSQQESLETLEMSGEAALDVDEFERLRSIAQARGCRKAFQHQGYLKLVGF